MSESNEKLNQMAVALKYDSTDKAPIVVASGMGYMAERIIDAAVDADVPIYEDNSLATMLSRLSLGQEIPEELYKAIVEIYVFFLNFGKKDTLGDEGIEYEKTFGAQEPENEQTPAEE